MLTLLRMHVKSSQEQLLPFRGQMGPVPSTAQVLIDFLHSCSISGAQGWS